MKIKAFTLAEVLITLGIIGVVAALTMPTLIQNYKKHVTVSKLKSTYSILSNAVKMSEVDNGPVENWEYPTIRNTEMSLKWFNKYFVKYLKYTISQDNTIHLANGIKVTLWDNGYNKMHIIVVIDNKNYIFLIGSKKYSLLWDGFQPYNDSIMLPNGISSSRDEILEQGCNNDIRHLCPLLIMLDDWKIEKDYPW